MCAFQLRYDAYRLGAEEYLASLFSADKPYGVLQKAMSYSLLSGGKRVRPVLTAAFCDMLCGEWRKSIPFGCALELVHTYSLIHDDLPCMDDDDLRRGKPTCHKAFGETVAVLAGDALQAEAFRVLASAPHMSAAQRVDAVAVLAEACGADGMVAGQILDTQGLCRSLSEVENLHRLKTGAMIRGAVLLGCIAGDAGEEDRRRAASYAEHVGLAFQVRDDMLDVIADQAELGKPIGSDREEGKVTFVDLLGLDACERMVRRETERAKEAIREIPGSDFLLRLADRMAERRK